MNNGSSNDRLDRIEAIVESNSRAIQAMVEQQANIQAQQRAIIPIVESNSRAIQALAEQQTTDRLNHEERMRVLEENLVELRQNLTETRQNLTETRQLMSRMVEVQSGLNKVLVDHDQERSIILRRLITVEKKVDTLIERKNN